MAAELTDVLAQLEARAKEHDDSRDPEENSYALGIHDALKAIRATQQATQQATPVGTLYVSKFRGHLENSSFDYTGSLPDGTYTLYTAPPPTAEVEDDADPLFQRRTPEAAARQMAIVLMNLLECQYATLEGMPKRTSQYERKRQESIAGGYLRQLIDLDIQPDQRGLRGYPCPRVRDAMLAALQSDQAQAGKDSDKPSNL